MSGIRIQSPVSVPVSLQMTRTVNVLNVSSPTGGTLIVAGVSTNQTLSGVGGLSASLQITIDGGIPVEIPLFVSSQNWSEILRVLGTGTSTNNYNAPSFICGGVAGDSIGVPLGTPFAGSLKVDVVVSSPASQGTIQATVLYGLGT